MPFNGSPPAVTATIQGETQMMFAVMQPLQPQIQAGKLRAIAVTTAKRFPLLPDLPTIAESGYPGLRGARVERHHGAGRHAASRSSRGSTREINAILKDPDVAAKMQRAGLRPDRRHAGGRSAN